MSSSGMNSSETPTLVLLPGMDGTGELFEPLLSALEGQFNTLVVSYPNDRSLSYAELQSIVLKALPTDSPFVLLGESFSGPIAISLAALQPPQLKGLVLCSTFVRNPRPRLRGLSFLLNILPLHPVPIGLISTLLLGHFSTPALRRSLHRAISLVTPSVMRARLRAVLTVDVAKELACVSVPTLYLRATHDRLVLATASALISQLKPDIRITKLDAPHCALQAAPHNATKSIKAFVSSL